VELVNALEQAKTHGKAGQIALKLMYVDLVILDELGYLPFSQAGGALLFHLLSSTNAPVCSSLTIWGLPSGGKCLVM
jgi:DNA replication protein DnaC